MTTAPEELPELPEKTRFGDEDWGYIYAYTADQMRAYALAALAQRGSEGAWISVEDRLPEPFENGMPEELADVGIAALWNPNVRPDCGHRSTVTNVVYFLAHLNEFTHWMPLPAAPAGGEVGK